VAREHDSGFASPWRNEEVGHLAADEHLGLESEGGQAIDDELLAAFVGRRDGPTPDQRLCQFPGFRSSNGSFPVSNCQYMTQFAREAPGRG
jgi:hypothetical protein